MAARTFHITLLRRSPARSAEPRPDSVAAIALTSLIGALIFLIPPIYFTQIAAGVGVTASSLGVTTTVLLLIGTLTALATGPLADRHGVRALLVAGSLAAGGYLLGYSLAPSRALLLPAAALGGVAYAILPNLSTAAAGSVADEAARRRALGWNSASAALSVVIVSPLLAVLVSIAGWRPAFAVAALLSLGVAVFVHLRVHSTPTPTCEGRFITGYATLLRHRKTRLLLTSSVLRAICWMGMLTYLGAFLGDQLNAGALAIAVVFAAGGSASFAGSLLTPRVMNHMPATAILAATQVAMALLVGLLFFGSRSVATALIVTMMVGLAGGFSFVTYATVLVEQTPAGRGTTMSLSGILASGAATIGGALGGAVLAVADYHALALVLPVPAILAALVLYWPERTTGPNAGPIQRLPAAS